MSPQSRSGGGGDADCRVDGSQCHLRLRRRHRWCGARVSSGRSDRPRRCHRQVHPFDERAVATLPVRELDPVRAVPPHLALPHLRPIGVVAVARDADGSVNSAACEPIGDPDLARRHQMLAQLQRRGRPVLDPRELEVLIAPPRAGGVRGPDWPGTAARGHLRGDDRVGDDAEVGLGTSLNVADVTPVKSAGTRRARVPPSRTSTTTVQLASPWIQRLNHSTNSTNGRATTITTSVARTAITADITITSASIPSVERGVPLGVIPSGQNPTRNTTSIRANAIK